MREKLDIVLITYNRRDSVDKTLKQLLEENSPVKDFDITILNNSSTDGTTDLINEYTKKYANIKQLVNPINIGGCANIAKAYAETAKKDYVWVLCDNDDYDWSCWSEVETAINSNKDVILTRNCPNTPAGLYYTSTLVSACIYKRKILTETVVENMYDNISTLFPHLAIIAKVINDGIDAYIVSKDIVHAGINPNHNSTFVRGVVKEDLPPDRRNIFWSVGYFSSLELIKDKKFREQIIEGTRHYHKSLFDLFKSAMVKNKVFYNNYPNNFYKIYKMLNFSQKIKLIGAYLVINLSRKDYTFYDMRSKSDWEEYFKKVEEDLYISIISGILRNKKVMLYGAGMTSEVILENYDLSGLDIVGIADRRFERTGETTFMGLKTYKPSELKDLEFDYIIYTLKLYKRAKQSLENMGIYKLDLPLIKPDRKYAVRV